MKKKISGIYIFYTSLLPPRKGGGGERLYQIFSVPMIFFYVPTGYRVSIHKLYRPNAI